MQTCSYHAHETFPSGASVPISTILHLDNNNIVVVVSVVFVVCCLS